MSDSVQPHRRQPTRLPYPWDSPDKNTGVGCHFLLQFKMQYWMAISRVKNMQELLCPAGESSINLKVIVTTEAKWSGWLVAILLLTILSLWWGILQENFNFCQWIGSSSLKAAKIEKRQRVIFEPWKSNFTRMTGTWYLYWGTNTSIGTSIESQ